MKLNRFRVALGILMTVGIFSGGCHTSPKLSGEKIPGCVNLESLNVDPRCAIVIGRVRVDDDGEDVTRKTVLYWRRIDGGADPKVTLYAYPVGSDSGFIITSLPIGKYKLEYANNPRKFDLILQEDPALPGDLEFEISSNNVIHYLGDVSVHWKKDLNGTKKKTAVFGMVAVGVLTAFWYTPEFGPKDHPPAAEVEIMNQLATTKAFFEFKFPASNLPIEKVAWPKHYEY
jgi:hypothetical protein